MWLGARQKILAQRGSESGLLTSTKIIFFVNSVTLDILASNLSVDKTDILEINQAKTGQLILVPS